MKVLFVITARGGSKGVPRKNIRLLGGIPLVAYKIIAAKKCRYDKRIIVSTDDEEIARVSRDYGAEVPFLRPSQLATDSAASMDVVLHTMSWVGENDEEKYDYVCLLEPSSPFASYRDLDEAIRQIREKNADTLLGMKEAPVSTNFIHSLDDRGGLSNFYYAVKDLQSVRRQDQKKEYTMNGCMYIAKWDYLIENHMFHAKNSLPYVMQEEESIEIDTWLDFEMATKVIDDGYIDIKLWK